MPAQLSSISANDGKAVPLAHTFASMGAVSNSSNEIVATYINRAASVLTGGAERFVAYFKQRADGGFSFRCATVMPITEVVNGTSLVTRTLKATTTFDVPANATAIERKDIRVLHAALLIAGAPASVTAVDDGTPVT